MKAGVLIASDGKLLLLVSLLSGRIYQGLSYYPWQLQCNSSRTKPCLILLIGGCSGSYLLNEWASLATFLHWLKWPHACFNMYLYSQFGWYRESQSLSGFTCCHETWWAWTSEDRWTCTSGPSQLLCPWRSSEAVKSFDTWLWKLDTLEMEQDPMGSSQERPIPPPPHITSTCLLSIEKL